MFSFTRVPLWISSVGGRNPFRNTKETLVLTNVLVSAMVPFVVRTDSATIHSMFDHHTPFSHFLEVRQSDQIHFPPHPPAFDAAGGVLQQQDLPGHVVSGTGVVRLPGRIWPPKTGGNDTQEIWLR